MPLVLLASHATMLKDVQARTFRVPKDAERVAAANPSNPPSSPHTIWGLGQRHRGLKSPQRVQDSYLRGETVREGPSRAHPAGAAEQQWLRSAWLAPSRR